MEARSTDHEAEEACQSGAVEFLPVEHTGVEIDAHTVSYIL